MITIDVGGITDCVQITSKGRVLGEVFCEQLEHGEVLVDALRKARVALTIVAMLRDVQDWQGFADGIAGKSIQIELAANGTGSSLRKEAPFAPAPYKDAHRNARYGDDWDTGRRIGQILADPKLIDPRMSATRKEQGDISAEAP